MTFLLLYPIYVSNYHHANSGKSFTMSGFGEYLGIKYRSILKIFEILDLKQKNAAAAANKGTTAAGAGAGGGGAAESPLKYQVDISVLSVCEEQVFDLLLAGEKGRNICVSRTQPFGFFCLLSAMFDQGKLSFCCTYICDAVDFILFCFCCEVAARTFYN